MVIDASVWVAAFVAHDSQHAAATGFLRKLVEKGTSVSTPFLALAELAGAIARQTSDSALAEKAVSFLRTQRWIQFAPLDEAHATAAASTASKQRLRGADSVYVALAAQGDSALITLDREMAKRAPVTVAALTPSEWLAYVH